MGKLQAGESLTDELFNLRSRADLNELRSFFDEVALVHGGTDGEEEFGAGEIAVVVNRGGVDGIFHELERQSDEVAGDDSLEELAEFFIEIGEADAEIVVVVERQVAGLDFQRECAQRTGKRSEQTEKDIGMAVADVVNVAKSGEVAVDSVEKPKAGNVGCSEIGQARAALPAASREDTALGCKNFDETAANSHQIIVGGNIQQRRDILRIKAEGAGRGALDTGNLQGIAALAGFALEEKPQIFFRDLNRFFGKAGVFVFQVDDFGEEADVGAFLGDGDVQAVKPVFGNRQENIEGILFRLKKKGKRFWRRGGIGFGNLERKAIGE